MVNDDSNLLYKKKKKKKKKRFVLCARKVLKHVRKATHSFLWWLVVIGD